MVSELDFALTAAATADPPDQMGLSSNRLGNDSPQLAEIGVPGPAQNVSSL